MFAHRGSSLAVTISLASVVLADILVQPGYTPQYHSNLQYSQYQPVLQQHLLPKQYHAEQLTQEQTKAPLVQYRMGVHTGYPYYGVYQNQAQLSPIVGYPLFHHYRHVAPTRNLHLARIGGRGYVRPSLFVGQHQLPSAVHSRYRRATRESASASKEPGKRAIVAHNDDVAAKSSLISAADHAQNHSHLPQKDSTVTTDKRLEKRQNKNDQTVNGPFLLGLYPEKMTRQIEESELDDSSFSKDYFVNALKQLREESTKNPIKIPVTDKTRLWEPDVLEDSRQAHKEIIDNNNNSPQTWMSKSSQYAENSNMLAKSAKESVDASSELPSEMSWQRAMSQGLSNEIYEDDRYRSSLIWPLTAPAAYPTTQYGSWSWPNVYHGIYDTTWRNFPDPRPTNLNDQLKLHPPSQQNALHPSYKAPSQESDDSGEKGRSGSDEIIGMPKSHDNADLFAIHVPQDDVVYDTYPAQNYMYDSSVPYKHSAFPYFSDMTYVDFRSSDPSNSEATTKALPVSSGTPRTIIPLLATLYKDLMAPKYVVSPQSYSYYYVTPSTSFYGKPLSSIYY